MSKTAFVRHHRKRIINRRIYIVRQVWGTDLWEHEGYYSKYNLVCSCWMCRGDRREDNKRIRKEAKSAIKEEL